MKDTARAVDGDLHRELAAVAEDCGCQLLEIENRGGVLRLTLDREEGVTLEDCAKVSRRASALLDVADFGPGRYLLEVSSPGLDRKLYGPEDFQRFTGRTVRVTFHDPEAPTKKTVTGRLEAFHPEGGGELEVSDASARAVHRIALGALQGARLVPEL